MRWPRLILVGVSTLVAGCSEGGGTKVSQTRAEGPVRDAWFTEITREVGLDFVQESGAAGRFLMPEIMGGGVALFDSEGDGDLDVYLVNGNGALPSTDVDEASTNRFYRQGRDGALVDATLESGLGDGAYGMGVAVGDVDNDGDRDVFVTNYGPDRLFLNGGSGRFQDGTSAAGIAVDGWSSSASFFDYDRDGFLDLYVAEYVVFDPGRSCHDDAGRPDYCGPKSFAPVPDVLLRNDRNGRFRDESRPAGMGAVAAAGLGVSCADFDGDGWQDVYVANDAYANQLWVNAGNGTFHDEALFLGVAVNLAGQPEAGMGVLPADLDRDGRLDLFVTHLRQETNTLYLNRGDAGFRDATGASGLGRSSMRFTGFGTAAIDFDNDADLDLLVLNGGVTRGSAFPGVAMPPPWDAYAEPNLFYLDDGESYRVADRGLGGGLVSEVEISRGLAYGDVDGDGDVDVLVGNVQGPARLYRNDCPSGGNWLTVRCLHPEWKRDAVGALVALSFAGSRAVATIGGGSSYQSSSPPIAYFGLGSAETYDELVVTWPDGLVESFPGGQANVALELVRGSQEDRQ